MHRSRNNLQHLSNTPSVDHCSCSNTLIGEELKYFMEAISCKINVLDWMLYTSTKWELEGETVKFEVVSSIINQTDEVASILKSVLGINQPYKRGMLKIHKRRTQLKMMQKWRNGLCSKDGRLETGILWTSSIVHFRNRQKKTKLCLYWPDTLLYSGLKLIQHDSGHLVNTSSLHFNTSASCLQHEPEKREFFAPYHEFNRFGYSELIICRSHNLGSRFADLTSAKGFA